MLGTYYSGNQIYPLFDDTIHFEMQICLKLTTETASLQLEYVERRVVLLGRSTAPIEGRNVLTPIMIDSYGRKE